MTTTALRQPISREEIIRLFEAQKAHQYHVGNTSITERRAKLAALHKAVVVTYRQQIREALRADLNKPRAEADLIEVYAVAKEIRHARANLRRWTGRHYVTTPLAFWGSSSYIRYEPKGVCLIMSPWNFPLSLTLGPLVSAIAAGNTAIVKPSEYTPHTSELMGRIIGELFDEREVVLIEGGVDTATELLKLPFNHIFFTGSPAVGKIVMEAAAKNLSSVTLELGGKSPSIIDETADIRTAARRTAWGKWINSGQICIAPDHVFIHESKVEAFRKEIIKVVDGFYGADATSSPDYSRMIHPRHLDRVAGYLDEAVARGAVVVYGGSIDRAANSMGPTIVEKAPMDCELMQQEIFGPVLPLIPYSSLDSVIDHINDGEKPLALYMYSNSRRNIRRISSNTRAGTTCINHNGPQFFNSHLPFGGANHSGIGKSHGFYGFEAFSNARGYYRQHLPGALELLVPPYRKWKEKLIDWTVKYF